MHYGLYFVDLKLQLWIPRGCSTLSLFNRQLQPGT